MTTGQSRRLPRLRQELEAARAEPLEVVGRRARLEGAPAEHVRAGRRHAAGALQEHLPAFDRAGAGDDDGIRPADRDAADRHDGALGPLPAVVQGNVRLRPPVRGIAHGRGGRTVPSFHSR